MICGYQIKLLSGTISITHCYFPKLQYILRKEISRLDELPFILPVSYAYIFYKSASGLVSSAKHETYKNMIFSHFFSKGSQRLIKTIAEKKGNAK